MFVYFCGICTFHSCQIFASLSIQGASNLDAFVSGFDICLSQIHVVMSLYAKIKWNFT